MGSIMHRRQCCAIPLLMWRSLDVIVIGRRLFSYFSNVVA